MHRPVQTILLCALLLACARASGAAEVADPPPRPSGGSGVDVPAAPLAPAARRAPAERATAAAAGAMSTTASPAAQLAFDGIVNTTVNLTPPDTHIAAGRGAASDGRVVMVTNLSVGIWDKTGAVVAAPLLLDTMFGADAFDPKVLYDQHSERFFIVALEGKANTPGLSVIHIAVSSTGSPDDLTTDWTFLSGSAVTTFGGASTWADYPGIGADAAALFVTTNQFEFGGSGYGGKKIRVFDKAALLAGSYSYVDLDQDAAISGGTAQPAHVYGATASGAFYLVSRIGSSTHRLFAVTGHPAAPVVTSGVFSWNGGDYLSDPAPQCATSNPEIDTLASRVQNAVHRDGHLWAVLTSDPDMDGESEFAWTKIATNGYPFAAPLEVDAGYIDGSAAGAWTYMPAIGVNRWGDAAVVYTQSSASECPNMYYATRRQDDAAGSFRAPVRQRVSAGFYDSYRSGSPDRWGDYAASVIDPDDDCFWLASEFVWASAVADSDWGTHIAKLCTRSDPPVPALRAPQLAVLAALLALVAARRVRARPPAASEH